MCPDDEDWVVPIGKARIAREGSDVTIVSFSRGMSYALEAAETLAGEGIDAEVIDLTDAATARHGHDYRVGPQNQPDRHRRGSLAHLFDRIGNRRPVGAEAFDYLDAPPTKVSGADIPMPYAANLEKLALPTAEQVSAARKVRLLRQLARPDARDKATRTKAHAHTNSHASPVADHGRRHACQMARERRR